MSPLRTSVLALGFLAMACARGAHAQRRDRMPPPAPVVRAGTRDPGAGPVPGSSSPPSPTAERARTPEPPAARPVQGRRPPRDEAVRRAIETASSLVGQREIVVSGVRWGNGCAALVRAAFAEADSPLPEAAVDARELHAFARDRAQVRRGHPAAGDLMFLSDRPGGPPDHVGLVESVSRDGTALVLHRTDQGVLRLHVNGGQPWKVRRDDGRALNDVLVVGAGRVPAGRLLVAYATVL